MDIDVFSLFLYLVVFPAFVLPQKFFFFSFFFFFFLCFARAKRNLFLGGGGEEDRGLSFLTTSWKSRFLNRRVEFFFSFSLFIFISLSFHSQLLSDIWVSGESLTKLHESIYIEIIFSTRWNEWLEGVGERCFGNRSINGKVFENWNSRTLLCAVGLEARGGERWSGIGKKGFFPKLSFSGTLSSSSYVSLSLFRSQEPSGWQTSLRRRSCPPSARPFVLHVILHVVV